MLVIQRKIEIKAIVTENLKNQMLNEIQAAVKKLEAELVFIEQRAKKTLTELTLKASPQVQAVREQLEWEKKKREEAKAGLFEQAKMIGNLQEGTEIVQGEIEGPVELNVGDRWDEIFGREIVIKDGVVIEIR